MTKEIGRDETLRVQIAVERENLGYDFLMQEDLFLTNPSASYFKDRFLVAKHRIDFFQKELNEIIRVTKLNSKMKGG